MLGAEQQRQVKRVAGRRSHVVATLLVFLTLCGCSDDLGLEFDRLCADAPTKIVRKIPPTRSYIDATGNGCSIGCFEDLRTRTVDFVEVAFMRSTFEARGRTDRAFVTGFRLPPGDGHFEVRIPTDGQCESVFLDGRRWGPIDPALRAVCLVFEPTAAFTSQYEYREIPVNRRANGAVLVGTLSEFREVTTRSLIASSAAYTLDGNAAPLLPVPTRRRCGEPTQLRFAAVQFERKE